ncbi:DHS-like NAD/FAD-binding domain-containing protein [Calocera cornea HHB12733]|uniref:DHS-like NAD/FAD-binding domain-containing protein n=1 Tax=Calocera cornea HHB12733 TaxID=1353952 RepID=A0A165DJH1_9BASI|nr:DHS-like NAD/FAD-binding domain-containing protein [Calocera cornea HHB12733]
MPPPFAMGPKAPTTAHIHIPPAPAAAVPSHAKPSQAVTLKTVAHAIARGRRVIVVCGAGVSVAAGIPDFRSSAGLFKTLRDENPTEVVSSGKDLFDTRVFQSPQTLALFNRTMSALATTSSKAHPTIFHTLLRKLEDKGKLLRVYTQNIDALEEKAGLELGVPIWPQQKKTPTKARRGVKRKADAISSGHLHPQAASQSTATASGTVTMDDAASISIDGDITPTSTPRATDVPLPPTQPLPHPALNGLLTPPKTPSRNSSPAMSALLTTPATAHTSAGPSAPATPPSFRAPRCIPVHGTLRSLYCVSCGYSVPLESKLPVLATGSAPSCPKCAEIDAARQAANKRSRGIGRLRPSVVLYGEEHKEGEAVGECVRRDLVGLGDAGPGERAKQSRQPDLLIVVGTSLQVPGTRRIVKEFSKAVRPIVSPEPETKSLPATDEVTEIDIFGAPDSPLTPLSSDSDPFSGTSTPTPSPRKRPAASKSSNGHLPIRTVYVNFDYPTPARDWEGVFDVWIQGDAQVFAKAVEDAMKRVEREEREAEIERIRKEEQRERLVLRREEDRIRKEEEARRAEQELRRRQRNTMAAGRQKAAAQKTKTKSPRKAPWKASPRTPTKFIHHTPPKPRTAPNRQAPSAFITPMKATAHILPSTPESLIRYTPTLPQPIITPSPTFPLRLKIRFPPGFMASMSAMLAAQSRPRVLLLSETSDDDSSEDMDSDDDDFPHPRTRSEYMRNVGLGLRKKKELSYRGMT